MREKLWKVPLVLARALALTNNGRSLAEASGTVHQAPVNKI